MAAAHYMGMGSRGGHSTEQAKGSHLRGCQPSLLGREHVGQQLCQPYCLEGAWEKSIGTTKRPAPNNGLAVATPPAASVHNVSLCCYTKADQQCSQGPTPVSQSWSKTSECGGEGPSINNGQSDSRERGPHCKWAGSAMLNLHPGGFWCTQGLLDHFSREGWIMRRRGVRCVHLCFRKCFQTETDGRLQ